MYEKLHWAASVQVCFKGSKISINVDGGKGSGEKKWHTNKKKVKENNGLMTIPIAAVRRRSVLAKAALRS